MKIDDAKYTLSQKIAEVKKLLRSRKLELGLDRNESTQAKVHLNGFAEVGTYQKAVEQGAFRDIFSLMDYIYMCELDEAKRRQLALFIIMQFSFKDFKKDAGYDLAYNSLKSEERKKLALLEQGQDDIRRNLINRLKDEFLRDDKAVTDLKELKKISWNGTRKQLAELFVELEQKGWINIKDGERKPICNSITHLFHILKGDKVELINEESFYTTFRPDPTCKPSIPYKFKFVKVYSTLYTAQFDKIETLHF